MNEEKMNDKKPTNDTELIAALWGMVRHLQNEIHAISGQAWAISKSESVKADPHVSKCVQNIDGYTNCIYEDTKAKDGTLLFKKPTEILERGAVRLIQLGWKTGWSDYVGWDDRRQDFAERNRGEVEKLGGDPFGEYKKVAEEGAKDGK